MPPTPVSTTLLKPTLLIIAGFAIIVAITLTTLVIMYDDVAKAIRMWMAVASTAVKVASFFAHQRNGVVSGGCEHHTPVPPKAPGWYAAFVSLLEIILLDTGGVVNSECLDGDRFG